MDYNITMQKLILFCKKNSYLLAITFILFASIILRTYNLPERIHYGSDSVRDAVIAQEALARHEIPLIGSFSSAGPFVFGPLYYWLNMLAVILFPFIFEAPWLLLSIVSTIMVFVLILIGYTVGGKKLSILMGLLGTFSPQFISRATGLSQHAYVGIAASCLLLFYILFWKRKSLLYPFLMGISFGFALSMHYQALNFFVFAIFIFFVPKMSFRRKVTAAALYFIGFIIPSLPLLIWDSNQQFANIRNILDYIFIAQYRIYVPNSWKIFTFHFLPDYWSNVVGGNKVISGIIMTITPTTFVILFLRKKIPGIIISIASIFIILLVFVRYYRGERFDGYMIYIAPFIFLISAWVLVNFFQILENIKIKIVKKSTLKRITLTLFIFSVVIILVFDFKNASQFIFNSHSNHDQVILVKKTLLSKFPNTKFQIYDFNWGSSDYSYALSAFLQQDKKTSPNGMPIGIINTAIDSYSLNKPPLIDMGSFRVVVLKNIPRNKLKKPIWTPVNPPDIYDDLMKWQKTEKLKSPFSLSKFIEGKIKGH